MDYSSMSTLLTCPKKYYYSQVEKLAPAQEATALGFGKAWHKIMEYHNDRRPNPLTALDDIGWVDPYDDYRTREKLTRGYLAWAEQYRDTPWDVVVQEVPVQHNFGGFPYEGRVDVVVNTDSHHGNGVELWLGDYKTASRLELDWIVYYRVSNQFKLYYAAMKEKYPNLAGMFVDVYHATKGVQKGKTEEERRGNRFYREFFRYDDGQIEEAVNDFIGASEVAAVHKGSGNWPKNTNSCHHFNRPCPFLDMCDTADPKLREMLKAQYVPNMFNPLEV